MTAACNLLEDWKGLRPQYCLHREPPQSQAGQGVLVHSNRMFEARLQQAQLLKKVLESIKDLVTDANFDCSATGAPAS